MGVVAFGNGDTTPWPADGDLGVFQLDGQAPIDLGKVARSLLSQLSYAENISAVNASLGQTTRTSFHMFATNRTETCHYHPGDTASTVLWGTGRFYRSTEAPALQPRGSQYFIPEGAVHAFGHVDQPTVVTVAWTPPFHANYTIPSHGCIGLEPADAARVTALPLQGVI